MTDPDAFAATLTEAQPPPGLSVPLRVLWLERKGDWDGAHDIAQDLHTDVGSWLHAYLHRREGDLPNADYWYRRAGRRRPSVDMDEEWREMVAWFLEQ